MKIKIFAFVFALLLTAFTIYAVLDTFVISRVYQTETVNADTFLQSQAALANKNDPQNDPQTVDSDTEIQQNTVQPEENVIQEDASQQDETTEENPARRSTQNGSSSGDSNNSENDTDNNDGNSDDWESQGNYSDTETEDWADWGDSSDNNTEDWANWEESSDENTDEQETRRSSSNNNDRWENSRSTTNNGDSNNWGRGEDTNNGDSGNWSWEDDTDDGDSGNLGWGDNTNNSNWGWGDDSTNDGPLETTVTDEEAIEYIDDNIQITISLYEVNDSIVYAADVRISSAEYLKSAFAKDKYGKNVTETTSEIASSHDAILAINGDYYGARESGYVIRNGVLYRDEADDAYVLCIYADGTMAIIDPSEISAQELVDQGVWQAYSFGPALVENGEIIDTSNMTSSNRNRGWGWGSIESNNPRTAIGIYEPLHYLFLVTDGRTDESEGLTLTELAEFMYNMGVTTAYNLDGGGSSTMVFQGEVINQPTSYGARIYERDISDILYIGY